MTTSPHWASHVQAGPVTRHVPRVCVLCRLGRAEYEIRGGHERPTVCDRCVQDIPKNMIVVRWP